MSNYDLKKIIRYSKTFINKKSNETYLEKELCSVKFVPLLNDNIE